MKYKMKYLLLSILLVWLVLDQLTIINVRPSNLLKYLRWSRVSDLSEQSHSKSYGLKSVITGTHSSFYFEPTKEYYIITTAEGVAKVNKQGETTFKILNTTGNAIQTDVEGEHFVLTSRGIINLHDDTPILQVYNEVRHLSDSTHEEQWRELFKNYYTQSEYALFDRYYAQKDSLLFEQAVHLFVDKQWITLVNNSAVGSISTSGQSKNSYMFYDNGSMQELNSKTYPLYLMKDVKRGIYSNFNKDSDADLARYYEEDFPHKGYVYRANASLKVQAFKKLQKNNYPEVPIWLFLPVSWLPEYYEGIALNCLRIANEDIFFKSAATRPGLDFGKADIPFYLFDVPFQFYDKESCTFLYHLGDTGAGVYVIKKREL